jgi:hypothetical protein
LKSPTAAQEEEPNFLQTIEQMRHYHYPLSRSSIAAMSKLMAREDLDRMITEIQTRENNENWLKNIMPNKLCSSKRRKKPSRLKVQNIDEFEKTLFSAYSFFL